MTAADRVLFLLVTGLGLGLIPFASGTFGTLPAVALGVLGQRLWFRSAHRQMACALWSAAAVLLILGWGATGLVERAFEAEDPKSFTLDEVVGYFLTLGMICWLQVPTWRTHFASFLSFRLFDILKPSPAREVEHWRGAPGIMADDVVAGIYAGLVLLALQPLGVL